MKRMAWLVIGTALLLWASVATAQSLGDVARATRKTKPQQTSSKQYDNDNLPTTDHLSVVGPEPSNSSAPAGTSSNAPAAASDSKDAQSDREKTNSDWQAKIEDQKKKIDSLNHELDLTQREYRLKAVAMYSDAGNRLRNSSEWDKEDREYKEQIEAKQKEVDAAKSDLDNMLEGARKAGVPSKLRE